MSSDPLTCAFDIGRLAADEVEPAARLTIPAVLR